ncbi:hypothetical protein ACFWMJ_00715 [Streptomyces hawaiiensis]|uniref:hypothetical protein n=1 Tax=Streptomyces hawaiiensis TaxID=67305 RepID=UPI00364A62C9
MAETLTFLMTVISTMCGVVSMLIAWAQWRESKRTAAVAAAAGSRAARRRQEQRARQGSEWLGSVRTFVAFAAIYAAPAVNFLHLVELADITRSRGMLLALLNATAIPSIYHLWNRDDERGMRIFWLLVIVPFGLLYGAAGFLA